MVRFKPALVTSNQREVENTVIETKGDSTVATFLIRVKDSKKSLICTVDWFSYISHGDYVVLWVKPES